MSAPKVIEFPRPDGEDVAIAWAVHRAIRRAEAADPSLLTDEMHVKAAQRAQREFERLYSQWGG